MTEPRRTLTPWCVGQLRWLAILIACELGPPRAPGAEAISAGNATFFETRIRPVLAEHCVSCHGEEKQKGKLRLDSEAGLRAGGESGPVVVPGHPEQSRLIQAVTHTHADLQVPPKKKMGARAIADLTRWVKAGAAWPASPPAAAARPAKGGSEVTEQDRAWWAFQPIRRPPVPSTKWQARAANPIDRFVFAQLESKGLTPNPSASPRELVRRVHFDLVGLPPSPEEVDAFASHPTSEAWEELVDRLLARPEYGERWGRHWLDVVRFAQSNGYERDGEKPYAWRYRDYVVRAFNQDKPYDQFVREQIAGDELPEAGADAIIATGFQRLGVWDDEPDDKRLAEFEELDDILSTTSTAFLGLTLGCARCHDHKFDPIPHADYYRMLAFYRNVTLYENARYTIDSPNYVPLADRAAVAEWKQAHASRLKPLEEALAGATNAETKKKLARQVEQTKGESPPFPWALAVRERGPRPPPTRLLIRGNAGSEGPEVEPAFLSVLDGRKPDLPEPAPGAVSSGRRRVLAEWIASPGNPLTARVMANRIWQHHFGRGLVKTASDFGHAGTPPTHPQLLDWLADEFIAHGWSVKALHKTILLSAVYRMSSRTDNPQAEAVDPDNDFFWRQNLRRLEAESLRDTVLAISGQLNPVAGGRGFFPRLSGEVLAGQSRPGLDWEISSRAELARRSIYAYVRRTMPIPVLEAFDYNNTASPVSERPVTTVAPQALMLLNDEFMQTQADAWAARLVREAGPAPERQIQRGFRLALGRDPTAREAALAREFLADEERALARLSTRQLFRPDVPASLSVEYMSKLRPEDFLRGPAEGWTYHRGHWSSAYEGIRTVDRARAPFALTRGEPLADGQLTVSLILHQAAESAGLLFRGQAEADEFKGYEVVLDPRQQKIALRRHGKEPILLGEQPCPIPTGRLFTVRVEATGARLRVWTDREMPVLEITDGEPLLAAGRIGLKAWGAALSLGELAMERPGQARPPSSGDVTVNRSSASARQRALAAFCLMLLNLNEVVYVD